MTELHKNGKALEQDVAHILDAPRDNGELQMIVSRPEVGAREIENLIGRLEHGVFS